VQPCIKIRMDPHCFGCPGSGSVLGMRIRIQEHGSCPKLTNIFLTYANTILITCFKYIFHVKFNFCDFRVCPGSRSGSGFRMEIKSWIRNQICIETSEDPRHCYPDAKHALHTWVHLTIFGESSCPFGCDQMTFTEKVSRNTVRLAYEQTRSSYA
jgi:hypothetical protein